MAIMQIFARAQTTAKTAPISGSGEVALPAAPAPAYTTSSTRPPRPSDELDAEDDCTDAVDDFFGVTYTREERRARRLARLAEATHASRHDAPIYVSDAISPNEKAPLPSYPSWEKDLESASVTDSLPDYSESASSSKAGFEPFSIPQGLHRWGFFCPLFWFLGALLLINFHSPTELVPIYTPEESALRVNALRTAERRWAGRCLLAWIIFMFFALATAGVTYGIVMSLKN